MHFWKKSLSYPYSLEHQVLLGSQHLDQPVAIVVQLGRHCQVFEEVADLVVAFMGKLLVEAVE